MIPGNCATALHILCTETENKAVEKTQDVIWWQELRLSFTANAPKSALELLNLVCLCLYCSNVLEYGTRGRSCVV